MQLDQKGAWDITDVAAWGALFMVVPDSRRIGLGLGPGGADHGEFDISGP
jgi:hypothetical protein